MTFTGTSDLLYDEGGAVCNVRNADLGAVGDGATDDYRAFYDATQVGVDVAHPVGIDIEVPSGIYFIDSDITIASRLIMHHGAILKPGEDVEITITGGLQADAYQLFDLSLGGTVAFASNSTVRDFPMEWWAVGLDSTDDEPRLTAMVAAVPNGSQLVFHGGAIHIASTWTIPGRHDLVITSRCNPQAREFPTITWSGASSTDAMVYLQSCHFCTIEGFWFRGDVQRKLKIDGAGGTRCTVRCRSNRVWNPAVVAKLTSPSTSESVREYWRARPNTLGSPRRYAVGPGSSTCCSIHRLPK